MDFHIFVFHHLNWCRQTVVRLSNEYETHMLLLIYDFEMIKTIDRLFAISPNVRQNGVASVWIRFVDSFHRLLSNELSRSVAVAAEEKLNDNVMCLHLPPYNTIVSFSISMWY